MGVTSSAPAKRSYNSPVRRQQAADTRARIVAAGVDVVHELADWDWAGLTFRAVAKRAGVSESTVYRHFASERELHGAVMERLHELAGVDYSTVTLDNVGAVAAQVVGSMAEFVAARVPVTVDDPTIEGIDKIRRASLSAAVEADLAALPAGRKDAIAGLLDVLWSPTTYGRLTASWGLDPRQADDAVQWAIGVVVDAARNAGALSPAARGGSGTRRSRLRSARRRSTGTSDGRRS